MKYAAVLLLLSQLAAGQDSSALSLKTRIALPSVNGRMDHFSADDDLFYDAARSRVYVIGGQGAEQRAEVLVFDAK